MTSADSDPHGSPAGQAGTDQGEAVLVRAVAAYRAALGSRLIAGYALGSLAHGGFSPLVSDVDLGLILEDPVRAADRLTIRTAARSVRAGGSALDQRLSVFWGTPATLQGQRRGGRFPPLDRLDLLEYGRLLTGTDARSAVARPDRTELLVAGAEFALGYLGGAARLPDRLRRRALFRSRDDDVLTEIRTPSRLVSAGPRRVTKIVLFPVRFSSLRRPRRWAPIPSRPGTTWLVRTHLPPRWWPRRWPGALEPPADDEAAALLGRELVPLYVHYIDDHIARLRAVGHDRLADRFHRWRTRLLA